MRSFSAFFTLFLCASLVEASVQSDKTLASEGDSEGAIFAFFLLILWMYCAFSGSTSF